MEKDCGMWINILSHKLKKRMNASMQSLGITGAQSRVMHYILVKCADGPVFQRDVESIFGLSRSTATGILQLMEKNGLILRESVASDARLKSLIPTEKAAQLDEQIGKSLHQTEQRLTQGLSSAQLALFLETAAHMSANLDE
ncbi:MAG: MarR family transcriptional regulator [Clostridiales bacterium]|nr:MarR family transcriptional regulator [Clostridiales bacterium]